MIRCARSYRHADQQGRTRCTARLQFLITDLAASSVAWVQYACSSVARVLSPRSAWRHDASSVKLARRHIRTSRAQLRRRRWWRPPLSYLGVRARAHDTTPARLPRVAYVGVLGTPGPAFIATATPSCVGGAPATGVHMLLSLWQLSAPSCRARDRRRASWRPGHACYLLTPRRVYVRVLLARARGHTCVPMGPACIARADSLNYGGPLSSSRSRTASSPCA